MTKKANNMLSFLFNLGFLPTWSTSWFWPSKGTRKSRRLRGLDPVEIDALETWKSRTRAGRASAQGSVKEVDVAPSEVSEEDTTTDKYLLLLLFFLLGISLLYLAILPFCSAHPDTCRAPYRSLRKVPALVGDLLWTAGNSTVNLLHLTGDKVITEVSLLQDHSKPPQRCRIQRGPSQKSCHETGRNCAFWAQQHCNKFARLG